MPHASRSILFSFALPSLAAGLTLAGLVALGSAIGGCSSIQASSADFLNATSSQVNETVDGGVSSDTGTTPTFNVDAGTTVASPYTGSPLCHATSNTCFPDTTAGASATNGDAGADATTDVGTACPSTAGSATADADITDACRVRTNTPSDPMPECAIGGQGEDGAKCAVGADCAAGYDCMAEGVCRKYCCSGSCGGTSNGAATFCDIVSLKDEQTLVPACMPVVGCDLLGSSCPAKETCSIVKDDGTTSCVAIGTAGAGDSCDALHCGQDLVCLGQPGSRQCFALCKIASPSCDTGTVCKSNALTANDTSVGICETPQM